MSETPALPKAARATLDRAAWREAARIALPSWQGIAPTIFYCLRTLVAIGIALYTAFSLQLLSPMSSVITVLIVANPVSGALVSKSLWRLLGTFIGAAAAVLLMACFAQTPVLFYIFLSFWIGVACVASTLLRFFKAYGAVLAGYTIIIVCAPSFADPQDVFTSAISRLSAVSVGIASAAVVFLLTRVRRPSHLDQAISGLVRSTAGILAEHAAAPVCAPGAGTPADLPGTLPASFYERREALLAQANGLNEIIEYAAADSFAVARHARRLRLGAAGLIGALTALHPLLRWPDRGDTLTDDMGAVIGALGTLRFDRPQAVLEPLADLRDRLAASLDAAPIEQSERSDPSSAEAAHALDRLGAIERAQDLLARLHDAVLHLTMPGAGRAAGPDTPRLLLFLDWPTALRNGARGATVTMLACMFWYITEWPSAPTLLAYLVPASCLLATNPSAAKASVDFATGTLLAIPASYVCQTWLLPQIEGFPLLLASLAICLLPGIWLQFHPRQGLRAFGYVVFFSAMIAVRNPISFNDITLFNTWLAFIIGTVALVVVFRALLPPNPGLDANRLIRSLARAAAQSASRRRPPAREVWENLQVQKVARLTQRLQSLDAPGRHDLIDRALITIELGRDVLRLRQLLRDAVLEPQERQAVDASLAAIGHVRRHPQQAARSVEAAATLLFHRPGPPQGRHRIAALLHEIALLIAPIAEFLSSDKPVPAC